MFHDVFFSFFQLLSKPKFSVLEKIKTIGSTYMVAAGLQPGKEGERAVSVKCVFFHKRIPILNAAIVGLTAPLIA